MEILISNKTLQIEKPGVSPICREEEIGRTGAGLQTRRQSFSVCVGQICSPRRYLGAKRNGRLRGAAFRIAPVRTVLYEHHGVAQACSASRWRVPGVKESRDYRD